MKAKVEWVENSQLIGQSADDENYELNIKHVKITMQFSNEAENRKKKRDRDTNHN